MPASFGRVIQRTAVAAVVALFMHQGAPAGASDGSLGSYVTSARGVITQAEVRRGRVLVALQRFDSLSGIAGKLHALAGACRKLEDADLAFRLRGLAPPAEVRTAHRQLARSYELLQRGCVEAAESSDNAAAVYQAALSGTDAYAVGDALDALTATMRYKLLPFAKRLSGTYRTPTKQWAARVSKRMASDGLTIPGWLSSLS